MDEFEPSADFVGRVMRGIAEFEEGARLWKGDLHYHLLRLAVAALGLLGSALVAVPCH